MPLDSIALRGLSLELNKTLSGARIDKIHQPGRHELCFSVYMRTGNARLYVALSGSPRVYISSAKRENPEKAPMFCMLLRKHLTGSRILSVGQPGLERMLNIRLECTDELGIKTEKELMIELVGRHSNLILADNEGRIIDCLKRVDYEMSEKRPVLPGLFYRLPPVSNGIPVTEVTEELFAALLGGAPDDMPLDKWLLAHFSGLSPLICREIVFLSTGGTDTAVHHARDKDHLLYGTFQKVAESFKTGGAPCLLKRPGEPYPFDFSFMPIAQYGAIDVLPFDSYCEMLACFYDARDRQARLNAARTEMARSLVTLRDRQLRKLSHQREELKTAAGREKYRRWADLLMASLHLLEKGRHEADLPDLFSEETPQPRITVPLDVRLSPHQNAQKYYAAYAKMKNAEEFLTNTIYSGESQLSYIESVLDEINRCETVAELSEISEELIAAGFRKTNKKELQKKKAEPALSPYEYRTGGGFIVWAGRNNRENEQLTLKTAARTDYWFHIKNAPGSHIILRCDGKTPGDADLTDAAVIAAYHSSARHSALVPVDYTQVKHVKKLKGGGPGMVNYDNYQTAHVTPAAETVEKLHQKKS